MSWRAGIDLNPLDPSDPDTVAWLSMLIWPEHSARRERLVAAAEVTARMGLQISRGDLRSLLPHLLSQVPDGTTPVVFHSATLAYLDAAGRADFAKLIADSDAHWVSFEGRGVVPGVDAPDEPLSPNTLFVAALDGVPYALANGHGDRITVLPG